MAKASTDEKDEADLDDADASAEDRDEADSSEESTAGAEERPSGESGESTDAEDSASKALVAEGEDEEDVAAAQLGTQRYVLAAFFGAGLVGAFVLGRAVHGIWAWAGNKDWFHNNLPVLAAVADEEKTTYATILGAVIAILLVIRTYRRAGVRSWADEVATELSKVKWPTRKEVSNSTVVVIAASAIATLYLALLDRLWSFVTDLFYGTGS
jgi:preprotein translocase subunit SecE